MNKLYFLILIINFQEIALCEKLRVPAYGATIVLNESEKQQKYTNIMLNIDNCVLKDKSNFIPRNFKEAVILFSTWIDKGFTNEIVELIENKKNLLENTDFDNLGVFLEQFWELKSNNSLSLELQRYGVYSLLDERAFEGTDTSWIVSVIFEGIYQLNKTGEINSVGILNKTGSISTLHTYDFVLQTPSPPEYCKFKKIQRGGVDITSRPKEYSQRSLKWTECSNGETLVYLWERGWFKPDEEFFQYIGELKKEMMNL